MKSSMLPLVGSWALPRNPSASDGQRQQLSLPYAPREASSVCFCPQFDGPWGHCWSAIGEEFCRVMSRAMPWFRLLAARDLSQVGSCLSEVSNATCYSLMLSNRQARRPRRHYWARKIALGCSSSCFRHWHQVH